MTHWNVLLSEKEGAVDKYTNSPSHGGYPVSLSTSRRCALRRAEVRRDCFLVGGYAVILQIRAASFFPVDHRFPVRRG